MCVCAFVWVSVCPSLCVPFSVCVWLLACVPVRLRLSVWLAGCRGLLLDRCLSSVRSSLSLLLLLFYACLCERKCKEYGPSESLGCASLFPTGSQVQQAEAEAEELSAKLGLAAMAYCWEAAEAEDWDLLLQATGSGLAAAAVEAEDMVEGVAEALSSAASELAKAELTPIQVLLLKFQLHPCCH